MDSITQALLGGAVGVAVAGRRHPRRAWLYGALAGTAPDLDVFIDYGDAVENFVRHRGPTHSWLVHTVAAPLLAWVMAALDRRFSYRRHLALLWLVLVTHAGLDALTVYGTQLLWPLPLPPVSGGSVFIIDPLYSLPLALLAIGIFARPSRPLRLAGISLALSSAYLLAGLVAQQWMERRVEATLARQGIEAEAVDVTAAPFNIALWRIVVMTPTRYLQGFASLFDDDPAVRFTAYDRGNALAPLLDGSPALARLRWFSHGFVSLASDGQRILATDLRMGTEGAYVFRFVLMTRNGEQWQAVPGARLARPALPAGFFPALWRRVFDPGEDAVLASMAMPR